MNFRMHPLVASLASGQLSGFMKSGECVKSRAIFEQVRDRLKSSQMESLLPDIPEGGTPSGVCLPLLINGSDDSVRLNSFLREFGYETYDIGLLRPLHLSLTIQKHRLLPQIRKSCYAIPSHPTHILGSCTNTEIRCRSSQVSLKVSPMVSDAFHGDQHSGLSIQEVNR